MLRNKDLELFATPTLKFIVFDEVHTYTGALGSEVACLTRRIKSLFPTKVQCIGTSATVANEDSAIVIKSFASKLFGESEDSIIVVEEEYKERSIDTFYSSNLPNDPIKLLDAILAEARVYHLQEDIDEINEQLLALTIELTGIQPRIDDSNLAKMGWILAHSQYIQIIENEFSKPKLPKEIFKRLKNFGDRKNASDRVLEAELLSYLTLGALAKFDNEPVIRPKLHYFIKGLNSASVSYEYEEKPKLSFSEKSDGTCTKFNLKICRTCGQHYHESVYEKNPLLENGIGVYNFVENRKDYQKVDLEQNTVWQFTNKTHHCDEENQKEETIKLYLCKNCGALHKKDSKGCHNPKCRSSEKLIVVDAFELKNGESEKCYACGSTKRSQYLPITEIKTTEVLDVMILAQTMISTMSEQELKKLLVFADGRQDAAFQASWMSERSKRFHLRFLAHKAISEFVGTLDYALGFDGFVATLSQKAEENYIYPSGGFKKDELNKRIRWFMIDEFASSRQRSSLENLGMCKIVYEGLNDFCDEWSFKFGISYDAMNSFLSVLLDYFRKKGAISDELARRKWNDKDVEIREGIIPSMDRYFPHAFVFTKKVEAQGDRNLGYIHSFKSNGRSAIEQIIKNSIEDKKVADDFIEAFWNYCIDKHIFVDVELVQKGYAGEIRRLFDKQKVYQINKDFIGFVKTDNFYICNTCKKTTHNTTPNNKCPTYNCKGILTKTIIDEENYDVYQYTKLNYVPIKPEEHSAQVNKEKRDEIEKQFKKTNGYCNCLVATPTLEMGVDIGKLEMVLLKNVPPSTPNYTQRIGRAGRRHRIATVFTYCRSAAHDSYFFESPEEMISGNIRIPTFSMSNQQLVKKHIHSAILTWLRNNKIDEDIIKSVFPTYIRDYVLSVDDYGRASFLECIKDFQEFESVLTNNFENIYSFVKKIFYDNWTESDKNIIDEEFLKKSIEESLADLKIHLNDLLLEIKTYRNVLKMYKEKELLSDSERREFNSYDRALNSYTTDSQENYSLSYLQKDGYFPSYALGRESVKAICLEPLFEISRASGVAIRELTPANKIYANKNIFEPIRLNFSKLKEKDINFHSEDIRKDMIINHSNGSILENEARDSDGGDAQYEPFISYQMVDISLNKLQKIDDNRDSRLRIGFKIGSMVLTNHFGGQLYQLKDMKVRYLKNGKIRLVNMGTYGQKKDEIGFLICPSCGALRNPMSSEAEHKNFIENHMKRCFVRDPKVFWSALHTDIESDLLIFDSFNELSQAANFFEAVKSGAIEILDMRDDDIDGAIEAMNNDTFRVVLYDSLPGGSGFLPLFLTYYKKIIEQAIKKLSKCDCEDACYKCLLTYQNQQYHEVLDRNLAIDLIRNLNVDISKISNIPANLKQTNDKKDTDSDAEDRFLKILKDNFFPEPTKQYAVDLGNNQSTVADFAYTDKKLLIFIDGLSRNIHGNPIQAERDKLQRKKAEFKGYKILEISAQTLKDEEMMRGYMEMISMYLCV